MEQTLSVHLSDHTFATLWIKSSAKRLSQYLRLVQNLARLVPDISLPSTLLYAGYLLDVVLIMNFYLLLLKPCMASTLPILYIYLCPMCLICKTLYNYVLKNAIV